MVSGKAWQAVDQNPIVALHAAMGLGPTNHKSLRYDLDLAKTDVKYGNPGTARQWVLVVPTVSQFLRVSPRIHSST